MLFRSRIQDGGEVVFSRPTARAVSLSFNGNYVKQVPFSITLECYPSGYFDGQYGILDPSNEYSYQESPDGTLKLTHKISAKGFNTSSSANNALENAKKFVQSFTGTNNEILPLFISGVTGANLCLKNVSEEVNRFNSTYSISQEFDIDRDGNPGVLRYTTDVESGIQDGLYNVTINGNIDGCRGTNITGIRNRYKSLDIYSICNSAYNDIAGLSDLNTMPLSSGVSEFPQIPKLAFNIAFNNDKTADTWIDYNTSLNTDILTDISTYNFEANFKAKGRLSERYNKVKTLYSNTDLFLLMGSGYSGYSLGIPLNPAATSSGLLKNTFIGEINVKAAFNNEPLPPNGFSKFEYQVGISPAINKCSIQPLYKNSYDGNYGYYVQNLTMATRGQLSIRGSATMAPENDLSTAMGQLKGEINSIKDTYLVGTRKAIENAVFTTGNANKNGNITFEVTYSDERSILW